MRWFWIQENIKQLDDWPDLWPSKGFLWLICTRQEFEMHSLAIQAQLQWRVGGALMEPHVSDLINQQLPSQFDYTSWYDLLVFRRLAIAPGAERIFVDNPQSTPNSVRQALPSIDTSPVGFAVFDQLLLTVHPSDCSVSEFFINRLQQSARDGFTAVDEDTAGFTPRSIGSRMPTNPADLMLRLVNHMVDSYLDLRRLLTRQFSHLELELLNPKSRFNNWQVLLRSRNDLHLLEDTCEDQLSAIQEWLDALDEWPLPQDAEARRERELLRVRSRDVHEHISRVISHVRRLENSAESAVQIHFSAQGSRTNQIMRTLTVLTAVFLPLNLITGFFGMNFDSLPLIHSRVGTTVALMIMAAVVIGLLWWFRKQHYLDDR